MTSTEAGVRTGNGDISVAEQEDRKLLDAMLDLGRKRASDDDLIKHGEKLILPEKWDEREAISYLERRLAMLEEPTEFGRTFKYRPHDGAAAVHRALTKVFGTAGIPRGMMSMFGPEPPELISVTTGVDETIQVPWGAVTVPLFGGSLFTTGIDDPELGPLFRCVVYSKHRYKAHVEALFEVIAEELRERSIYKGKAINGATTPEFIDVVNFDEGQVVFSEDIWTDLDAHLWSMLRHTQTMRELNLPLKRAVLLDGDFGTGKTLAAKMTGKIAVEEGWTVIYCRPAVDDLFRVMQTARLYQPCVVVFEDLDKLTGGVDVSQLLDTFDGITAKGTELAAVLTTNKREQIVKGMLRPGRLDALITMGALDETGVQELAEVLVGTHNLDSMIDWTTVHEACKDFSPAFVREAIDRTKRYAVARSGGDFQTLIGEEDLVAACRGLQEQYDLMVSAGEGERVPDLDHAMRGVVTTAIQDA